MAGDVLARRAREVGQRPGAVEDRAAAVAVQPPRARRRARARAARQSTGTAASAACVGVEQAHRGDVVDQRAVGVVADRGDHRARGACATVRHSASSQNANRSASEPPPRATITTSTSAIAASSRSAAAIRGRGVAVLHGRERPHQPARPAAPAQAGEHVVARLSALAGDDPDRARQQRAREPLLRLEQAVGGQPAAQALELDEQVALAGDAQLGDGEAERRRGRGAARVVVAAAADHDPHAVGQRHRRAASKSVRHIEQGSAPRASRSSKYTRARLERKPHTSPTSWTRANSRSRASAGRRRSRPRYGPGSSLLGIASRDRGVRRSSTGRG